MSPIISASPSGSSDASVELEGMPPSPPLVRQHGMRTQALNNIFKPRTFPYCFVTLQSSTAIEPWTTSQAQKLLEWRAAMASEFGALVKNGT